MKNKYLSRVLMCTTTVVMFTSLSLLTSPEVKAEKVSQSKIKSEKNENVEGLFGGFVLGYWKNDGSPRFMLEGQVGVKDVTFTKTNVTKTLELIDSLGNVTSVTAANTNWYDKENYDGYQAVLRESLLPNLSAGDYQMRIRVKYDDKEFTVPITNTLSSMRAGGINEYITDINKVNSFLVGKIHYNFKVVAGQLVLNVREFTPDANPISKYMNGDGSKRVHDGWLNVDYDFNKPHKKNIVVRNAEGKAVYRKDVLPTWDINKQYNLGQSESLALSGFQASFPKMYDDPAFTPYVELVDSASGNLVGTYKLYENQEVALPNLVIETGQESVSQGSSLQFTSNYKNATWSIAGQTSNETKIDANGLLTVGSDEETKKLIITAKNGEQIATKEITVFGKLVIESASDSVIQGKTLQLTSNYKENTTWSIAGQTSNETKIDANGLLTVGSNEEAKKLTISAKNDEQTATKEIYVTEELNIEATQGFVVKGTNLKLTSNYENVTWDVIGQNSNETKIDEQGVLVVDKKEESNVVTVKATNGEQTATTEIEIQEYMIKVEKDVIYKGETMQINTNLEGETAWSILDYKNPGVTELAPGTKIDQNGLLIIDKNEVSEEIMIVALNRATGQQATFKIKVEEKLVIQGDIEENILSGDTRQFTANFEGTMWNVEGQTSSGTKIDETGLLTIGANEKAKNIIVKAVNGIQVTTVELLVGEYLEVQVDNKKAYQGLTAQFTSNYDDTSWNIEGDVAPGTKIDGTGLLTIDADEKLGTLTIKATNGKQIKTQDINVLEKLKISSLEESVISGNTIQMTANYSVNWYISGENSRDTKISYGGLLTVGIDETSTSIKVKAEGHTSDGKQVATKEIVILEKLSLSDDNNGIVTKGKTLQIKSNYGQSTTWSIEGQESSDTHIDENGLLSVGVTEKSDTIRVFANADGQTVIKEIKVGEILVVTAEKTTVNNGESIQFSSNFATPKWDIIFDNSNITSSDTQLDQNGLLTIGLDERSKEIFIKVTINKQDVLIIIRDGEVIISDAQ